MDSPVAISYRCSIVTKCVSPAVFEIMALKLNWVTTLTFLGHVISRMRSDDLHWLGTLEPNISKTAGDTHLVTMEHL